MHEYEVKLLAFLNQRSNSDLQQLEKNLDIGRDSILWAIENLIKLNAISVTREKLSSVSLSEEGERDISGFPEETLVKSIAKGGKADVSSIKDNIALIWAKKNGWIIVEKGAVSLTGRGERAAKGAEAYEPRSVLEALGKLKGDQLDYLVKSKKEIIDSLLKRGLIEMKEKSIIGEVSITQNGRDLFSSLKEEKGIGALTKEAIASRSWQKQGFRPYDVNAPGEKLNPARLHPLREWINFIRQKWFEMGFIEMSGPIIESAFWNFDALFVPQDHPTREMQDTFFLKNPKEFSIEDVELMESVRKAHKKGWQEGWSEEVAKKALLRTQVTALSARYMKKIAETVNSNFPLKLFSVGPVFRNESVDYKHLAQFYQYEGIIVGNNLTLANLIDTLRKFYGKLGIENVKIRPSYFPFTEPSLEGYYYDEKLGAEIELTGGGIIRKEITKAMGLDKTVLAWGGGVERPILDKLGIDSITVPYKNNIGWLRSRGNLKV